MPAPRPNPMIAQSGFTVFSENKKWMLMWEDIGEGMSGDYDPSNEEDVPLFRACLHDASGDCVDSGSYCTLAVIGKATEDDLRAMSNDLFNDLGDDFNRKLMEMWTHRTSV